MYNFEIVNSLYNQLVNPKYTIYRSRVDKERFYFSLINGELLKLPSVTTILANTLPMEDWLIRWIARWGYEQAIERRNQSAHYGTLFSIITSEFLKSGQIDLTTIEARVHTYVLSNNLSFNTDFWEQKLKEDLYSLHCFINDYKFEPLAIELPLISTKYKFAGTIDAVGFMQVGSGVNGKILKKDKDVKKILVIIDWKTGRHGFYRSHEAQLHMYRLLFEENYPELLQNHELRLYNWAPREWDDETDTKYSFKDQTNSKESLRVLNYIAIYKVEEKEKSHRFKILDGVLKIGAPNGNLKYIDYTEVIKNKLKPEIVSDAHNEIVCLESNAKPIEVDSELISQIGSFFEQIKED